MTAVLPAAARVLIDTPEFGVLSTTDPAGGQHQCVMWVGRDGNDLVMATKNYRRQYRNLIADPRASVLVYSRARPQHYVHIRGTATLVEGGAVELADRLARAYTGTSHEVSEEAQRVMIRVTPLRVNVYGAAA